MDPVSGEVQLAVHDAADDGGDGKNEKDDCEVLHGWLLILRLLTVGLLINSSPAV
ncbi:hypothetical protein [Burkholderia cenocepacia]|uniref:hypothetical protein n=1 Tax=Burkholderia cenocepacia TaxID=95486 RepID=UPI000A8A5829|nr:hypothetical protein [Burkholderia cenocepacia]